MVNEKMLNLLVKLGAESAEAEAACSEDRRLAEMQAGIKDIRLELRDQRVWFETRFDETKRFMAEMKTDHAALVSKVTGLDSKVTGLQSDMAKVLAWIEKQP